MSLPFRWHSGIKPDLNSLKVNGVEVVDPTFSGRHSYRRHNVSVVFGTM